MNAPAPVLLALEGPPLRPMLLAPTPSVPSTQAANGPGPAQLALEGPPQRAALLAPPVRAELPAPQIHVAAPGPSARKLQADSPGAIYVPSYEWADLPQKARVPPGLEVRLAVDGSGARAARIPSSWRLLVVAQPANEACRVDVFRGTTLVQVRQAVATKLAGGDASRVEMLLADDKALAGGGADNRAWGMTIEQANLFGKRVTCTISAKLGSPIVDLGAQMDELELAVTRVERALSSSQISVSHAYSDLAQLEARLDRLQCKGIDSTDNYSLARDAEAAKQIRRDLTRRADLLHARLGGIFVGLDAAKRADAGKNSSREVGVSADVAMPLRATPSSSAQLPLTIADVSRPLTPESALAVPPHFAVLPLQPPLAIGYAPNQGPEVASTPTAAQLPQPTALEGGLRPKVGPAERQPSKRKGVSKSASDCTLA